MTAKLEQTTSGWMQTGETPTTRFGAKIVAAVVGGLVGFCIGPVTLDFLVGIVWRQSGGPWPDAVGAWLGAGIGFFVGAFLGAVMVGGSLVARWCRGTAAAVGLVAFLAGFAGPLILTPDNNLGPLIGIFLTGPLGFVGGAVIGLCIGLAKERRHRAGALPETNINLRRGS